MIEKYTWFPFASAWFGERVGRLVKGSGGLEIMVRERRRRCREKHRVSVRLTKILVYEVGQASPFTYPSV